MFSIQHFLKNYYALINNTTVPIIFHVELQFCITWQRENNCTVAKPINWVYIICILAIPNLTILLNVCLLKESQIKLKHCFHDSQWRWEHTPHPGPSTRQLAGPRGASIRPAADTTPYQTQPHQDQPAALWTNDKHTYQYVWKRLQNVMTWIVEIKLYHTFIQLVFCFYLCCGLFNNTISRSHETASNDRINE